MKILAIIPARGDSARLPGKNIRVLGDKPLIEWSIDVARKVPNIDKIFVSTDCNDIADVSKRLASFLFKSHSSSLFDFVMGCVMFML